MGIRKVPRTKLFFPRPIGFEQDGAGSKAEVLNAWFSVAPSEPGSHSTEKSMQAR